MHATRPLLALPLLAWIACSAGTAPPPAVTKQAPATDTAKLPAQETAPDPAGESAAGEHHAMPEGTADFHDLLSPLWHATAGPERTARTCEAAPKLLAEAELIRDDPTPPNVDDPPGWLKASQALAARLEELGASCATDDRTEFQTRFEAVHDAFHVMIEMAH